MTSRAIPSYDMISFQVYIWWRLLQVRQILCCLLPLIFLLKEVDDPIELLTAFSQSIHPGLFWQRCHGRKVERSGAFGFPNLTWEGFLD